MLQDFEELKVVCGTFFKLARAQPDHAGFTLGIVQAKSECVARGSAATTGSAVAANVQHQIFVLLYDKLLRFRKADKMRDVLHLRFALYLENGNVTYGI